MSSDDYTFVDETASVSHGRAWPYIVGPEFYPGSKRNQPCPCGSGRKFKKCHGAPKTEWKVEPIVDPVANEVGAGYVERLKQIEKEMLLPPPSATEEEHNQ